MGIFSRLAALIRANLNDLISKAEDPEKMLDQVVIDMTEQLTEAKKQVAIAIAGEKRLAKQAEAEAAKAAEWERRAMMAVRAGDDTLAMEALQRKKEHEGLATTLKEQWSVTHKQVDQLKQALRLLNDKIQEAKRKKQVLKLRSRNADAQRKILEIQRGMNGESAMDRFEHYEDLINQKEAEVSAQQELHEEASGDSLARKFKVMEQSQGATDDLEMLKQQMGLAPAPEPAPEQIRVAEQADTMGEAEALGEELSAQEQDELAAALEELEAQEQAAQARMKS